MSLAQMTAKGLFEKLYRENTDPNRLFGVRILRLLRDGEPTLVERAREYYRQYAEQRTRSCILTSIAG